MTDDEFQQRLSSLLRGPFLVDFELAVFELLQTGSRDRRKKLLEMVRNIPLPQRMKLEQQISRGLRAALDRTKDGAEFKEAAEFRVVLGGLEHFLPRMLAKTYPHWNHESLDGFYLSDARKSGSNSAELRGVCILISDQTLTPFQVRLEISHSGDKIEWMECQLGQRGNGKGEMHRVPCSQWRNNPLSAMPNANESIDWVYHVTFGSPQGGT